MTDTIKYNKKIPIIVSILSAVIWMISNINCPLRFTLDPLSFTNWHVGGLIGQLVLIAALLAVKAWRKYSFYPMLFGIYTAFYMLMSVVLPLWVGIDYEADFTVKIISDLIYFTLETCAFLPLLLFLKDRNFINFKLLKRGGREDLSIPYNSQPKIARNLMNISSIIFIIGVYIIAFVYPFRNGITADIFKKLLVFQLIFGLIIGIKDEIVFRWLFQGKLFKDTGSILAAILVQSVIWMSYHFFFGEGTGTGYFAAFMTLVAAAWWGYATYLYKSLWVPFIGHIGIELFGFYLMYGTFIQKLISL